VVALLGKKANLFQEEALVVDLLCINNICINNSFLLHIWATIAAAS
jgi:hypothetical protein